MKKTILIYSVAIAAGAFLLQWLQYQYLVRAFGTEVYIAIIALGFTTLGIWVGLQLTDRRGAEPFDRNVKALEYLGISPREYDVLLLLAEGHSNKEIASQLFVSPNTVKTHLARLYSKLEVSRRTQAIHKAKSLRMIP